MIPVSNPRGETQALRAEIDAAIARVLDSGWYILGREVEQFEQEFAGYVGGVAGVGVASGTDAVALALRALGIGPGDEVITVSHTALATVAAILQTGATPVLVDVNPETLTMEPTLLASHLSTRTKAVVPVHLYGNPAEMRQIGEFTRAHGLRLVEDCCQAHGSRLEDRPVGSFGDAAAFSFYPTKNLGAIGDGGMVVVGDSEHAARLKLLRQYGWGISRDTGEVVGINSRLDELQAAILRVKLRHLDQGLLVRREAASRYDAVLRGSDLPPVTVTRGAQHSYHLYVVRARHRAGVISDLRELGVETGVHYPVPVHLQPAYAVRCRFGDLPVTEQACREVLSLPMGSFLTADDVAVVTAALRDVLGATG